MDNIDNFSNFIFYQSDDGIVKVQVIIDSQTETIWASQKAMSEIFDIDTSGVTRHLQNIFEAEELIESSNMQKLHIATSTKPVAFYNLDVIISVGYRVNSYKATQFRRWATSVLKEYLIKGFALNDDRLKQGNQLFGKDYFSELLERIREIRSSERLFYQKITDLYMTSQDYDVHSPITKEFFATVQNKLHWAIHKHTAAELIQIRANANDKNMGLTSWKNEKKGGKIMKSDVSVAKNYLKEEELSELNRIVTMYLDFAENLAKRNKVMYMADWVKRLDSFLEFNEYNILQNAGKISAKVAQMIAEREYEKFRVIQDVEYKSDFDKTVEEVKSTGKIPKYSKYSITKALQDYENEKKSDFDEKLKKAINFNPKDEK